MESQLAVGARLLVLFEVEVAVAKVAVSVRLRMWCVDRIDDAMNQPQAFLAVTGEQSTVAEVRGDGDAAEVVCCRIAHAIVIETGKRAAEALHCLRELRVGLVNDAELVQRSQLPDGLVRVVRGIKGDLAVKEGALGFVR